MPIVAYVFGYVLAGLGLAGYLFGGGTLLGSALLVAIGVPLAVLGRVAQTIVRARKHALHAVAGLAGVGFFSMTVRSFPSLFHLLSGETVASPIGIVFQSLAALLCFILLGLCVRSFALARLKA